MAHKISFTPDNVIATNSSFERLKLKVDEKALIVVLEDATYGYTHQLKAPVIGPDGKPEMEWVKPWNSDEKVERFKLKWISTLRCLGDEDNLGPETRGVDPDNCPACAVSIDSATVPGPKRRFAVNVAQYATTKLTSSDVAKPFSASIKGWTFGEKLFTEIEGFQTQCKGLLHQHDLILGPCEAPEEFQKFKIALSFDAEYLLPDAKVNRKDYFAELFEENKIPDEELEKACGKVVDKVYMEKDLETVRRRWAEANGQQASEEAVVVTEDLNNVLAGKLKNTPPAAVSEDDDDDSEPTSLSMDDLPKTKSANVNDMLSRL